MGCTDLGITAGTVPGTWEREMRKSVANLRTRHSFVARSLAPNSDDARDARERY
jgi:hypothetical protein